MPKAYLGFRLPRAEIEALRVHADQSGETVSEYVRNAITQRIVHIGQQEEFQNKLLSVLERIAIALENGYLTDLPE